MSTPIIRYFPLKFIFSFKDKVLLTALKTLNDGEILWISICWNEVPQKQGPLLSTDISPVLHI